LSTYLEALAHHRLPGRGDGSPRSDRTRAAAVFEVEKSFASACAHALRNPPP
jgi:hypothetical protein